MLSGQRRQAVWSGLARPAHMSQTPKAENVLPPHWTQPDWFSIGPWPAGQLAHVSPFALNCCRGHGVQCRLYFAYEQEWPAPHGCWSQPASCPPINTTSAPSTKGSKTASRILTEIGWSTCKAAPRLRAWFATKRDRMIAIAPICTAIAPPCRTATLRSKWQRVTVASEFGPTQIAPPIGALFLMNLVLTTVSLVLDFALVAKISIAPPRNPARLLSNSE